MDKMPQQAADLLLPLLLDEDNANYFFQSARVWARGTGYEGAERKFKCYAKKHKHHSKCIQNIFADWGGEIKWPAIPAPAAYFPGGLPDAITDAAKVEDELMTKYDKAARGIMEISLGIFDDVNKLRKCATDNALEFAELVEKMELIDKTNRLSLFYFDRKVIRW
jgi:hypothetical protein